jgi:hypothetical protein
MLSPICSDRETALRLLCDLLALAAVAQGTTAVLRLVAWMDARDEDEGGFLWLAGALGYRPTKMEQMIRSTLDAAPRRRQSIQRKLRVHD